ncbi:MAG TPA: FtsQ-type POTRA domain-containing protein [Acidimicrobiales bacterium]
MTRWTLAIGVVVTGLAFAAQWVLHQPIFRVQHVRFVGLRHETSNAVMAASGLSAHPTMLSVSDAEIKAKLSPFTWINSVTVTKHWPNTVVVSVHESVAVAVAYTNKHVLEFVDKKGRALGPAPISENLPTLDYLLPKNATWPYQTLGRAAAYVASQLPRAFSFQVSLVKEDSSGIVTLKMTTPLTFILGPPTNLHNKFVAIASVIAHSTLVPGDVVDVTVPDELAVTPPGSS